MVYILYKKYEYSEFTEKLELYNYNIPVLNYTSVPVNNT